MASNTTICDTVPGRKHTADGRRVAAIYARYSTTHQDSTEDQVRECRAWAEGHGYAVPEEFVFADEGKRGASRRREGLTRLKEAISAKKIDAVVVFATSRLFRKTYAALQFVNEEIVERGLRAVFVHSDIDTNDKGDWETLLHVRSMVDEMQTKSSKAHIRAGHIGLFQQGLVWGATPFGYKGVPVEGQLTRKGKPQLKIAVCEETAKWVKEAFQKYVEERCTMKGLVKWMNEAGVPLPPRCTAGRWTLLAVRTLLTNARYRGYWVYGKKETRWQSKGDYSRQFERDEPLATRQFEHLRIIDDATWFKAQDLILNSRHAAGRPAKDGNRQMRPRLLNGVLQCGYHNRPLVSAGGQGLNWVCPVCKESGGQLYTMLNRAAATEVICTTIAERIREDADLVSQIVAACRQAVESQQRPDASHLDQLRKRAQQLTRQVDFVLKSPVETEHDEQENTQRLSELRRERAAIDSDIAQHEAAAARPVTVPTDEEVRAHLDKLGSVLLKAATSEAPQALGLARDIIERVTGGEINIYQEGPAERQRGWLRGSFALRLLRLGLEFLGPLGAADDSQEVELSFRQTPTYEEIADEVKRLWDEGLKYTEIAMRVGWNRNLVQKAVGFWHTSRGLPAPDGRRHMTRLTSPPPLAERIADQVMELVEQKAPMQDIAARLGTSRARVTEAVRLWHEKRGLPVPDGRTLRKLRSKAALRVS
jgi:DNA invertase Pin-like site-specific DNA recombinase